MMSGMIKHRAGGSVRAAVKSDLAADTSQNYGWVEGYLVSWGNENDTDLQGEHFTPRTEFCLDWFKDRPVLYHHGLDGETGLRKIGVIKSLEQDDLGLWVKAQLDLRDKYSGAVYDMVKSKEFGWSSGSVDHLVKIAPNGEIATWPLIEGSITPTPAQPSKTTVRAVKGVVNGASAPDTSIGAFKSVISASPDGQMKQYLRELNARVELAEEIKSVKSYSGHDTDGNKSAKRLARAYARAFGVRATDGDIDAVARRTAPVVENEVVKAATEELEALAALEEEMKTEEVPMAARSLGRRRSFRGAELDTATQMDELAEKMADEIAVEMEDELAARFEEDALAEKTKRALRVRAYRRALRTLESTDDVGATVNGQVPVEVGGVGSEGFMGETNSKSFRRRGVRGYARRNVEELPVASDDLEQALASDLVEEVAAQSYRSGFKRGARSALQVSANDSQGDAGLPSISEKRFRARRNVEELPVASDEEVLEGKSYRARRGYARRNADELATQSDDQLAQAVGSALNDAEKRVSYRKGYSAAMRRLARRNVDELPVASDEEVLEGKSFRARRSGEVPEGLEGKSFARRGFARRNTEELPVASDEFEAALSDEEFATQSDEFDPIRGYRNRNTRSFRGKSATGNSAEYWKDRAVKAELMEAPQQRNFGSGVTRDVADQAGSYSKAFKSYLYAGLGLMSEREKYVLKGKGKVDWSDAKGSFKMDRPGAFKTYYGGSDASVGFAVPPDWVSELNKNVMTQTVMAPECRTRTTTSDRIVQPNLVTTDARRAHAATVRWPGEVITDPTASDSTEDQFSQINVPIHVMLLNLTASISALEDVTFSLEDEINEAFSEAVAIAYDSLIWSGDGQGKLEGIVVNNQVVGSRSTGVSTVSGYIPSGSVDGLVNGDVLKEVFMHLPRHYRAKAKWYMNSDTALAIATLKDGEGRYLIDQRDEGLRSVGQPELLMGRPIVYNEFASGLDEGNHPIIFGDLSRGYIIGKRVDFSIRRFDDSQQALYDRVLFLGRARLGGQVLQPAALKTLKIAAS